MNKKNTKTIKSHHSHSHSPHHRRRRHHHHQHHNHRHCRRHHRHHHHRRRHHHQVFTNCIEPLTIFIAKFQKKILVWRTFFQNSQNSPKSHFFLKSPILISLLLLTTDLPTISNMYQNCCHKTVSILTSLDLSAAFDIMITIS